MGDGITEDTICHVFVFFFSSFFLCRDISANVSKAANLIKPQGTGSADLLALEHPSASRNLLLNVGFGFVVLSSDELHKMYSFSSFPCSPKTTQLSAKIADRDSTD